LSEKTLNKAPTTLGEKIAVHAKANNVPESLVRRVIVRESRYNAHARGRGGAMGLMQIKHATARGMGYRGTAAGLLDAETNLTYAVRYLAGAYRAAHGNANQAVAYYAKGYYRSRGRVTVASARTKPAVRQEAAAASPRGLTRETDASATRHGAH
jgi:soluble lytic murein transglycosylase-like protein